MMCRIIQFVPASDLIDSAHRAADAGRPVSDCPFPSQSEYADRWKRAYYAREMEILDESVCA